MRRRFVIAAYGLCGFGLAAAMVLAAFTVAGQRLSTPADPIQPVSIAVASPDADSTPARSPAQSRAETPAQTPAQTQVQTPVETPAQTPTPRGSLRPLHSSSPAAPPPSDDHSGDGGGDD